MNWVIKEGHSSKLIITVKITTQNFHSARLEYLCFKLWTFANPITCRVNVKNRGFSAVEEFIHILSNPFADTSVVTQDTSCSHPVVLDIGVETVFEQELILMQRGAIGTRLVAFARIGAGITHNKPLKVYG